MRTLVDSTVTSIRPARGPAPQPPRIEVVIPVHNDERGLPDAVRRLHARLAADFDLPFRVTIADNASSDGTATVARFLERELAGVRYLHVAQRGHGRALRAAWGSSEADVVAYTDAELATDLRHLRALLDPLLAGRGDLVVGSRLAPGAQVKRGLKRGTISRSYNALLGTALSAAFSDAQCAFKAARTQVVTELLPLIEDEGWFFDTELLYLAQRNGFSIREIPVRWVDDPDSSLPMARTALDDLRGMARLRRRTLNGSDLIRRPASGLPPRERTSVGRLRVARQSHARSASARPARSDDCAAARPDANPPAAALP